MAISALLVGHPIVLGKGLQFSELLTLVSLPWSLEISWYTTQLS